MVWVHPGAGGGRSGAAYYPGLERMVAGAVDAVEVYNGGWLGDRYVTAAEDIAAQLGLARTGGSDAHQVDDLMRCYTELPGPRALHRRRRGGAQGVAPRGRCRPAAERTKRFGIF